MQHLPRLRAALVPLILIAALLAVPGTASAANILANPGFETGSVPPWVCSGGSGSVVSTPVRTGTKALAAAASSSDQAKCSQSVTVVPNTAYTLSAWVRGNYVYLGVTGGASTWTPSASAYTLLTVAFTTGASQTTAEVFLHGWYGQGTYYADDVNLDGPGGNPQPGAPGVPGTPTIGTVTNTSVALSWAAPSGTVTGYRVYEGAGVVKTVAGTSATVDGLLACSSHSYSVAAYNANGESAKSAAVNATTPGCPNTGKAKR
ncbi:carbohydrate binding domain-containing protein [Phytomonospora sp. NPDC050363]|uniref:carbohydrate binding domain-containing protein n=1 Tax=Phytomonospora sp. NPDC050363 TaxID=3155642 RepID=UPI0033D76200